ncbi:MAG: LacI family transcriptional regulator, partial [Puniceicoccaceae bacterium]
DTSLDAHATNDERLSAIFKARGIRGCLLPFMIYHDRTPFMHEGVAAVGLGECPDQRPMHTVTSDYFKNLTTAVDALLAAGYQRIGFCEHGQSTVLSQGVHWGSFLWNQQRMPQTVPPLVRLPVTDGKAAFMRWFEEHRPDAILVTFYQAGQWLHEAGLRVPEDVGLAHLGLTAEVAGWSGVNYEAAAVGSAGVDMLVSHILRNDYGVPTVPKLMYIPGRWVQGRTTRPPLAPMTEHGSPSRSWDWFDENFQIGPMT